MPVIGTAGHVDHGKTALIEALTGMNPDRLPEEKARGMTIDLGFAFFRDDAGKPVGIIDVPGHERYIRNMVAGASGIAAAILVVAADDGWMEQTERHVLVLKALRVPVIAVALTKIDAVPPSRVEQMAVDTAGRVFAAFGRAIPIVPVSSRENRNIDLLRRAVLDGLDAIGKKEEKGIPSLSIDRIFTLKGTGLVVAGSLSGGRVSRGDELVLHPGREIVRVRSLQSYGLDVESAEPGGRVALNIPRPKRDVERGDCLSPAVSPIRSGTELVCRLSDLSGSASSLAGGKSLRNGLEIEVAVGAARRMAEMRLMRASGFVRLILESALPCVPAQRLVLIRHGGADILGAASIIDAAAYSPATRKFIPAACATLGAAESPGDHAKFVAALKAAAARAGSGPASRGGSPAARATPPAADGPSPEALAVYRRIEAAGPAGVERTATMDPAVRKEIGPLCEAKLLVPIDTDLFLADTVYRKVLAAVLAGKKPGSRFGVPEAKAATGYSRKYALPLLNRMERDGWVKRSGDDRVVVKEFPQR